MIYKWFPIFKTGKHTDSEGRPYEATAEKLDAIAAANNGQERPLCIGHPKTSSPAWGQANAFKREGEILYAQPNHVVPEFQEAVKKRLWDKVSISIRPDMVIRHIGFLGATPPAVQGLPAVEFKEEDGAMTFEFSEASAINTIGRVFQNMREWLIEKFDQATADRVVGNWEIDELKNVIPDDQTMMPETGMNGNFSKKEEEDMGEVEQLKKEAGEKDAKIAEFSEAQKKKDADLTARDARIRQLEAEGSKREFTSFCEGLTKEGKLTPAMRPAVMDFMEILSGSVEFEFAEADAEGKEKRVKSQPLERFKTLLSGLPKQVEFSEVATKGKAGDAGKGTAEEKLDAKAHELMKANKDITYGAAFSQAQTENVELATEYAKEIRKEG